MTGFLNGRSRSVLALGEPLCGAEDREMVKSGSPPPGSPSACAETRGSCCGCCLHKRLWGSGGGEDTFCPPVKARGGKTCESELEE